jgi:uncharacterized membrane protein
MGQEKDVLIKSRSKYRIGCGILFLISLVGFILTIYSFAQVLLWPARHRRAPFDSTGDFSIFPVDLMRNGKPTSALYGLAVISVVSLFIAILLLIKARNITSEIKATEAEVSRRLRVEERLKERRG